MWYFFCNLCSFLSSLICLLYFLVILLSTVIITLLKRLKNTHWYLPPHLLLHYPISRSPAKISCFRNDSQLALSLADFQRQPMRGCSRKWANQPEITMISEKSVPRQNVRRQNVHRDKTSGDKTSGDKTAGDITSVGQNVRRDKTSIETKRP